MAVGKLACFVVSALLSALFVNSAAAQEDVASWPSKRIRMIVASDAASGTDVAARLVSNYLSITFGQPFVIENMAGAGGAIAAATVARSAPDGYTVLSTSLSGVVLNPILRSNTAYKTSDLAPVGQINESVNIIAVHPDDPAKTLPELIKFLKENPDKYNYGSSGIGNINHLQSELFLLRTGTKMTHVPFAGGAGAITALLSRQIQFNLINTTGGLPQLTGGALRPLAVIARRRIPELPDIPAIQEIVPTMAVNTVWQGNFVARDTPRPIVEKLSAAMAAYLHSPDGVAAMKKIGSEPVGSSPQEFSAVVSRDVETWTEVIQKIGVKLE